MRLTQASRLPGALLILLAPLPLRAATYYVAPSGGSDSASGTEASPFATVGRAQTAAAAGDTVYVRGGRFAFSSGTVGVSFTKSGSSGSLIHYFAYPGEIPVFDLSGITNPSGRVTGLAVSCNYIHIRGLEVMGVPQYVSGQDSWGVRIQGSNNILENLNVHDNEAPGIFITSGANNLILNCDSHHNYDVLESGGSGDGFGCHSSGGGNILRGCRSYDNSDDGFDFINAAGSCLVEQSFAFRNGFIPGTTTTAGNGAGFKAGGYGSPPVVPSSGAATHTARQCVAFGNRSQGFYANHHPGRINFYNNTAFNNPVNYNMLADSGYPSSHDIRNNIAMTSGTAISNLSGGTATNNSWNLSVTVSTADFVSVAQAEAQQARQADGSLPNNSFMHLVAGSDLIDKGIDVGLPYNGAAPDLGAFETGSGGTSTGGTSAGGTASGGKATGGTSTGGLSTGGTATGGTSTGGLSTGGTVTGGKATGGASTGGASAGGTAPMTGGSPATGGVAPTGGLTSGGGVTATGGSGTGGSGAGGSGTAGSGTGGSGGGTETCNCKAASGRTSDQGAPARLALLGLALAGLLGRRRRARS
jgi:parallel beta-helix repeat protein